MIGGRRGQIALVGSLRLSPHSWRRGGCDSRRSGHPCPPLLARARQRDYLPPPAPPNVGDGTLALVAAARLPAQSGLRRGQTRDRDPERRARHVIERGAMAELDARGIATVLSADADLELGPRLAPARDRPLDQRADAVGIDGHERIRRQDLPLQVFRQEFARIVTRESEREL